MKLPLSLVAYRLATGAFAPLSGPLLSWRLSRGKEDGARIGERRGEPGLDRPAGVLVWLHGASVGEALSLLPLIERLTQRGRHVLITTGTVTSAAILADRLPAGAFHQFVPLDAPQFMRRFIAHWRPDIALIAESELWPNFIVEAEKAGTPIVLVNARLSERSFRRWSGLSAFIGALLARVDLCLAQSEGDGERFAALGAPNVRLVGNLKYDAPAPPADRQELASLSGRISGRQVWIAASTHAGEEILIGEAHRILARTFPDLLTLIAPRHPQRGARIAAQLQELDLNCALRSAGAQPSAETAVYICDTIGELGLFYRLAGVVFVGKSLVPGGGQNPIEPARLASAILHGPQVANFADVYALLDSAGGAALVRDAEELAQTLAALFIDGGRLRAMARAAAQIVEGQTGAVDRTVEAVEPYLARAALEPAS
ncbi:3-deoxy-D-manno-octulosonic acid transferase [Methylocapsa sp. S129]|uniref:3-deoxy-D-manno-octulosonic acid transferase n=1 Tax=Methylocapsa sp. S129 TaxID=1641869 RepID=UPI00131BE72C|nr:3-deoxy-D-manno-octulosonic acid transferase [Methylocapsa sp. S129]